MSFYIRDISKTDRRYFKTNADLLVVTDYDTESHIGLFNYIYVDKSSNQIIRLDSHNHKYRVINNDLYITNKIDIENVYRFISNKKYDSIELLIPESFSDNDVDNLIEKIGLYFADSEISVGILISNSEYINSHIEYLNRYNFYISHYIPESIDINDLEEDLLLYDMPTKLGIAFEKCSKSKIYENRTTGRTMYSIAVDKYETEESFKEKLIKYLNKSKKSNVEVYTKGGITRKLFSKILSEEEYTPKKDTICCLIIGMELCLDDALDLLNAAGYTLTNSLLSDVIIKRHINNKEYDICVINEELDEHGLTMLGWKPRD